MSPSRRARVAGLLTALALLVLAATGCDDDESGVEGDGAPATFVQPARSGSFLGTGPASELVLRGVGGASAIAAEGTGAGAAGAIATAKLFRAAPDLLGPEPWRATIAGAEVGPQRYSLLLSRPRYDPVLGAIRYRVQVEGGLPERPPASFGAATLTLASGLEPATLAGRVTSAEGGEPVAGALVDIGSAGPGLLTAQSEADGSFEVGPLPAGSYEVEASAPGYERDAVEVTLPDGTGAELSLQPQTDRVLSG
jgi:hypothetical protein